MAKLTVAKDDYGYRLTFTIQDSAGDAYDIDGYTVTLKVWKQGIPGTKILEEACTELVAASGTCYYVVQDEDFETAGNYAAELELTVGSTIVESTESFIITVVESG